MEKSKANSQERLLIIVEMLVENQVLGMSNKNIAAQLGASEVNICRDLKILEDFGWIEKVSKDGRWRMSIKFAGFAGQMMKGFQTAKLRLSEDEARYAAAMQ
jgi:DNA-binding IclR family transcriptional regulator